MISVASLLRGEPKDFKLDSEEKSSQKESAKRSEDLYSYSKCLHCNYSGCRRKMNLSSSEILTSPEGNPRYPCNKGYFANYEMFSTFTPNEYKRLAMKLPFHAENEE